MLYIVELFTDRTVPNLKMCTSKIFVQDKCGWLLGIIMLYVHYAIIKKLGIHAIVKFLKKLGIYRLC